MPVLVVGAESPAGRAALRALRRTGGEVRAFADAAVTGEPEAEALRALGVKVAVGDLDDEGHLEAALTRVHTVVHLAGGPLVAPDEHVDAVATTTSAALGAGCRRVVLASELSAGDPGDNPYLEAVAAAEEIVSDAPMEAVVLRCAVRYGPDEPLLARLLVSELPDAVLTARHAPLHIDDLGGAVAAADASRGGAAQVDVCVELVGPDEVALGDLLDRVRVGGVPSGEPRRSATVDPAVLDWLARGGLGGPDALGRAGTSLEEGLRGASR